jgi:hypothetical protein
MEVTIVVDVDLSGVMMMMVVCLVLLCETCSRYLYVHQVASAVDIQEAAKITHRTPSATSILVSASCCYVAPRGRLLIRRTGLVEVRIQATKSIDRPKRVFTTGFPTNDSFLTSRNGLGRRAEPKVPKSKLLRPSAYNVIFGAEPAGMW